MSHDTVQRILIMVSFSEQQYLLLEFCKRIVQYSEYDKFLSQIFLYDNPFFLLCLEKYTSQLHFLDIRILFMRIS
jgi:hypothetical protein